MFSIAELALQLNCIFSNIAGKIKYVYFTYYASFFSVHVLFLSTQIGLVSLQDACASKLPLTIPTAQLLGRFHSCNNPTPRWSHGQCRYHFGWPVVGCLLCPTPPRATLSILFSQEHYHYLEEHHEAQQWGCPFPAKGKRTVRWETLKFSDHSDISHSLRKTILKAGKQISLKNYLHQLTKHNNVSLET